jgi:hypothetical protein
MVAMLSLGRLGRLLNSGREATAKPCVPVHKGAGLSCAKAVATFAALMIFAGCPTTGGDSSGGPSSLAAVQGARTSQNIIAHENAQAAMNAQIIQDRRSLRMEEQAEARRNVQQAAQQLEAQRRTADAATAMRRQAEIQRQQQQQIERQRQMADTGGGGNPNNGRGNQGQGNQGQGNQGQGNQGQGNGNR